MALSAAKEYTDGLDQLSAQEKVVLKRTFDDLTSDTPRTPVAASRLKKFMTKLGPVASDVLQKLVVAVATEAAKKSMGSESNFGHLSRRNDDMSFSENERVGI